MNFQMITAFQPAVRRSNARTVVAAVPCSCFVYGSCFKAHIYIYIHTHTYIYIHTHIHAYKHTQTYIRTHTHIHTYIHFFFFFYRRYNPLWVLAFSVILLHSVLSLLSFLHPLIPNVWISSSISSTHLFLGLPLILLPVGFHSNISILCLTADVSIKVV